MDFFFSLRSFPCYCTGWPETTESSASAPYLVKLPTYTAHLALEISSGCKLMRADIFMPRQTGKTLHQSRWTASSPCITCRKHTPLSQRIYKLHFPYLLSLLGVMAADHILAQFPIEYGLSIHGHSPESLSRKQVSGPGFWLSINNPSQGSPLSNALKLLCAWASFFDVCGPCLRLFSGWTQVFHMRRYGNRLA